LFLRFGKEFGISPYKNMKKSKSIKRQEARGSATRSTSETPKTTIEMKYPTIDTTDTTRCTFTYNIYIL
jgi:hypothetical protein